MEPRDKTDFKTASLFIVLALLTTVFVFIIRMVLFVPVDEPKRTPIVNIEAQKGP